MRILILIAFLFLSINSFSRAGLAETFFETPGGHVICYCDPFSDDQLPALTSKFSSVINSNSLPILSIEKFYFYKNHIIGKTKNYYFIFDEANENVSEFNNIMNWKESILTQKLDPLYTKWLSLSETPFFITLSFKTIVTLLLLSTLSFLVAIITSLIKMKIDSLQYILFTLSVMLFAITYIENIYSF